MLELDNWTVEWDVFNLPVVPRDGGYWTRETVEHADIRVAHIL